MPVGLEENEFLLRCACGDKSDHIAYLIHEPDESRGNNLKGQDDDWYLHITLDPRRFWKRLWLALKFIWNPRVLRYCGYAELVLRNDDVDRLAKFIQDRRRDSDK